MSIPIQHRPSFRAAAVAVPLRELASFPSRANARIPAFEQPQSRPQYGGTPLCFQPRIPFFHSSPRSATQPFARQPRDPPILGHVAAGPGDSEIVLLITQVVVRLDEPIEALNVFIGA